ncbi:MAG: heme biosynthesis HemY N-terminal domain-containing protein [Pseudomonadota bacterium]
MIRVLIFLGLVLLFGFGFAWLADRPGQVAIEWSGYQIELSVMVAAVAVLALIVVVMSVWWVFKVIIRSPQIMGGYFSSRRRDKGYDALSSGLIAAGSGDGRAAERYTKQAYKYAPDAPLTKVLAASSADLIGDEEAKRSAYRRMIDDPKTQLLGLRGLYLDAVTAEDEEAARHYADKAAALAPALDWAGQAQFEDQVQRADWPAARAALERNLQNRIVTRAERSRLRAVLLTAEAIDREEGEPETARTLALEAHKLAPELVPAAAVAGRLLIRAGKMGQASKVLEKTWKLSPHPELPEVYLYVRPGDAVADRVKRSRKLAQLVNHQLEGELALARTLTEAGELDEARKVLEPFLNAEATQRVCLLMAEIEEKAGGETAAVRGWLARALRAKRDPAWVADGYISSTWEPVSPLTGRVDAFEWKVPVERFTAHDPVAIPDDAMSDDGQVLLPARFPGTTVAALPGASVGVASVTDANASEAGPVDGVMPGNSTEPGEDAVMVSQTPVDAPHNAPDEVQAAEEQTAITPVVDQSEVVTVDAEPEGFEKEISETATATASTKDTPADRAAAETDMETEGTPGPVVAASNDDTPPDDLSTTIDPLSETDQAADGETEAATTASVDDTALDGETSADGDISDDRHSEESDNASDTSNTEVSSTQVPSVSDETPYTGLPGGHAPDDPGIADGDKEAAPERRRFRLF